MTERSESERAEFALLADVLESRGRNNSLHDIKRAASALRRLAAPDHGGADAGVRDACWRTELDEIVSHLGAAITQSVASDDQIIMDHVKAAHEIAKVVRRQA